MKPNYKNLGKVCLTPAGEWDRNKMYERIDVVTHPITGRTYIAKKDVPKGVSIENQEYWQQIGSGGYKDNNIIIISDIDSITGELVNYNLSSAINSISYEDRRPGLILGFWGTTDSAYGEVKSKWFLYQFNSSVVDDWNRIECWVSIYDNIDKFKGFYTNEEFLYASVTHPIVGDFAFVGNSMEDAVLYVCLEDNIWKNTQTPAFAFANKYEAIYSHDFGEFETDLDETYADRATKDALGNVIHDTYVTRDGLVNAIKEAVAVAINELVLPAGSVTVESLSEAVLQLFNSRGGNIYNYPDEEDLTVKSEVLKFADKSYSEAGYSGYGRTYLRKNIVDGINVLEQYQMENANTRYIVQYFHCLNGQTITVPENCIIDMTAGGIISNGTLSCNDTVFIVPRRSDLNVTLEGTYTIFGE